MVTIRYGVAVRWLRVGLIGVFLCSLAVLPFGSPPVSAAVDTFINSSTITIPAGAPGNTLAGVAAPYPSTITVSGLSGVITDVNVSFFGIAHTRVDDLDILLEGPLGQSVILISDTCGGTPITVDFTIDDEAAGPLPDSDGGGTTPCVSGTYQPSNYVGGVDPDPFPAPAPGSPGATLAVFDGTVANGTWNLYVYDDRDGRVGEITGGWSLTITTTDVAGGGGVVTAEDVLRSQAALCADLTGNTNPIVRATIPAGTVTNGGVYCRVLAENGEFVSMNYGPAAVGNQDVIDMSVIQAVDVFGMAGSLGVAGFNNSVEVCLLGSGQFLYLDATQAPRPVTWMPASSSGGYTCANIPNAGTVVLVP